jgi:uncharacterized delta-60 repeat protein
MKKLHFIIISLLVFSAFFITSAFGNTVTRDTSFSGDGYSVVPIVQNSNDFSLGYSLVVQPDGKIIIAGDVVRNNQQREFALSRINPDGTIDTSFGTNGIVVVRLGNNADSVSKVRLQPDGKILLAGSSWADGTGYNILLVRYNSNGTLDTTFNSIGYVTRNINGESYDYAGDMALLPDGKIVVVGSTNPGFAAGNILIMRFNADGTPDTTFDGDGIVVMTTAAGGSAGQIILLSDGKYLVTGYRNDGVKPNFLLMRLNPDGTFDTSFGTGGTTVTSVSSDANYISSTDRQSDGKIVVVGSNYIVRYTPDGILDTSFGTAGTTRVTSAYETNFVKVTTDDKIMVSTRGVYRFTKNGWLDTHFANGGIINMGITNFTCSSSAIDVQTDGKLLIGGQCGGSPTNFTVARFQEKRTKRHLDFDGNGVTEFSVFRPSSGEWFRTASVSFASLVTSAQFGVSTDRPVPADYTGDGKTDIAVFRPSTGEWFVLRSEDGSYYSFPFGASGDIPVAADYDGDDLADAGVFRPSTNQWFIRKSTGGTIITNFGTAGDKPVPSDYDGDFKTDIAIYRPASGEWWINKSSDGGIYAFQFGASTDKPVPGDYTGDNKTDAAFWRPSTGEWFILRSEDYSYYSSPFGLSDDLPTPGNFSGDGRFDLAVFRPSTNTWHIQPTGGSYFYKIFGVSGDRPLPNLFVP